MPKFSEIQKFKTKLADYWDPTVERCGVINSAGEIIEVKNRAADPTQFFTFRLEDLKDAVASWHSHPSGNGNLSIDDYHFFKSWPNLDHYITSRDEVWCFVNHEGLLYLVEQEADHPAWASGQAVSS